jgi:peptidoglycan hydrolase CwlO-like protein
MKKNFLWKFTAIFFISFIFIFLVQKVFAISESECDNNWKDHLDECINLWEGLRNQETKKVISYKTELVKINTSIAITTARILQSSQEIENLEKEIDTLTSKIGLLDLSLDELSEILAERIAETYKKGKIDFINLFLSSQNFSDFVSRFKYLRVVQIHDRSLMIQMETARSNFEDQKTLKEQKQEELKAAKRKNESLKAILAQQKKEKESLLKEGEVRIKDIQSRINQAIAEQEAMLSVVRNATALLKDGSPISKGAEIALMGNTGAPCCSWGNGHLHFEITKGGDPQNPASYLKQRDVIWDNSPDGQFSFTGDWDWPMDNPRITQGFGMTYYAAEKHYYGGGPHTGIDMVGSPIVIRAPRDGTLYKGTTRCGSGGCPIKYVAIDHGDGLISWYWHVQ